VFGELNNQKERTILIYFATLSTKTLGLEVLTYVSVYATHNH
jgi:hypothetical protein